MPTLFDDIEEEAMKVQDAQIESVIIIQEHKQLRKLKEKHISYDHLPKREEFLSIPEGEDICNNGLPLYTIEKMFQRQNALIPRQNMANWVIGSIQYLQPLFDLMKKDLLSYPIIQADETTTQVLKEDDKPATSTSYMWMYRSSRHHRPIVLYDYQSTRSGDCPKEFLKGYTGHLETDAYNGYNKVENVIRCLCNIRMHTNCCQTIKSARAVMRQRR